VARLIPSFFARIFLTLHLRQVSVPCDNGNIGATVEESISNLARVSTEGMSNTDPVILDIMMNKC